MLDGYLAETDLTFSAAGKGTGHRVGGRYPFFTQMAGHYLVEAKRKGSRRGCPAPGRGCQLRRPVRFALHLYVVAFIRERKNHPAGRHFAQPPETIQENHPQFGKPGSYTLARPPGCARTGQARPAARKPQSRQPTACSPRAWSAGSPGKSPPRPVKKNRRPACRSG